MNIHKIIVGIVCISHATMIHATGNLDELAIKWGTDKHSQGHGYTSVYEIYFEPLRAAPLKFLEIGFYAGASAHMWQEYFPQAELYFIDNNADAFNESKRQEFSPRCHFFVGNQQSERDLLLFVQQYGGDFDVILDDGGHTMAQQIVTFKTLFPYVKSGGIYIIEDLHTSYWGYFGGGPGNGSGQPADGQKHMRAGRKTTIHFLKHLIDDINYVGAQTGYANKEVFSQKLSNPTPYQKDIKSIHFYSSLVIVVKN